MTSAEGHVSYVLLCLFVLLCPFVCGDQMVCGQGEPRKDPIEAFQDALRSAASDKAKRDVVLKAIDNGLIEQGTTLAQVERMFGKEFRNEGRARTGRTTGYVWFPRDPEQRKHQLPTSRPDQLVPQASDLGWRITFVFSANDTIECFWLRDKTEKTAGRATTDWITPKEFKAFREAFETARDGRTRRAVVLKGADDNLICPAMHLSEIKGLFGDTLVMEGRDEEGAPRGYISLDPLQPQSRPAKSKGASADRTLQGWYIEFVFYPSASSPW